MNYKETSAIARKRRDAVLSSFYTVPKVEGSTIGPLHGLQISLKDCFVTAPHPSSIGMAAFANEPLQADTLLVTMLRDVGAVFYVKTNVPVAMMMMETNNNIWGETRNPL